MFEERALSLGLSAPGAVHQRRAVIRRVKGGAGTMFQRSIAAIAAGTFLRTYSFYFRLDAFR
jgi:hypothetical protein